MLWFFILLSTYVQKQKKHWGISLLEPNTEGRGQEVVQHRSSRGRHQQRAQRSVVCDLDNDDQCFHINVRYLVIASKHDLLKLNQKNFMSWGKNWSESQFSQIYFSFQQIYIRHLGKFKFRSISRWSVTTWPDNSGVKLQYKQKNLLFSFWITFSISCFFNY